MGLGGTALLDAGGALSAVALLVLTFSSQALFLLGSGKLELSRPLSGWRLAIPATVVGLMLAILIGGTGLALSELFYLDTEEWAFLGLWALMGTSWIVWSFLLFIYCRGWERFNVIGRLIGVLFAGTLATFLVSIPAHIIVSRRPGCFVGVLTAVGIASGVYVMLGSFGPAILLLFLREKRRFELGEARRQAGDSASEIQEQPSSE